MLGASAFWHENRLLDDFCDRLLLSEKSDEPGLRYGLVNFRLRAARSNPAENLNVHQEGKSALIGEVIWESKHVEVSLFQTLSCVLCGAPVKRRMPCLL